MGWRRGLRSLEAQIRRQEREARRRASAAEKAWKAATKAQAAEAASLEVEAFEAQIDQLTSLHRECVETVIWSDMVRKEAPAKPAPPTEVGHSKSSRAKLALASYRPTIIERLFGSVQRKVQLELAVIHAQAAEAAAEDARREAHAAALKVWQEATEDWKDAQDLARRILAGDEIAYVDAIHATGCLTELLGALGSDEERVAVSGDQAELTLTANEDAIVPVEQKTLTARGAVSTKKFPTARRVEIYQDYVCGAALRAGREIMAVTPVESVLVHVEALQLDTATGHMIPRVILSALCTREAFTGINWEKVDASDLVERLVHRMKLTRSKGFQPVERLGKSAQRS